MVGCQVEETDFICATCMGIAALCSPGLQLLGAQVAVSRVGLGGGERQERGSEKWEQLLG